MTDEQRDALRNYITHILLDGDWLNDWLQTLLELGVNGYLYALIRRIGHILSLIGGF